jgi:spermidine/putrescine transport system substrate-binding protein
MVCAVSLFACGEKAPAADGGSSPATNAPDAGTAPQTGGEVNVYNWGEYIDESIFDDFEDETGIRVNYSTFESNESMYAALKLGGTDYDVIIPSDYMVERLIAEGMLEKLDFANIPNLELLSPEYQTTTYDPNTEYSVPYMWGTVGIIYNSKYITDEITSWGAMFDEKYAGQILMFDNPRDAFGIALKYLGYSLNTTDETEIQAAFDLLVQQKAIKQAYVMDTIFDKLEGEEAWIGAYYAGDYITMRENNPDLRFALPDEGANVFSDAMCVPKGAKNKTNAELFINFMSSTETAVRNMDMTGYVSANAEAAAEYALDYDEEDLEIQFPPEDKLARCEPFANLPQGTLTLYDTLWSQLKA